MTRTSSFFNLNEPLIFETSAPGKTAYTLPPLDVEEADLDEILDSRYRRDEVEDFPEVSEVDVIRHYTRLSTWNYHIDLGMYPLGSCTMKYNPKLNERVARLTELACTHPLQSEETCQGNLELIHRLQQHLQELTGMDAATLQPAAGSQGELAGILMIRAGLSRRGDPRKSVLVPDSAHGTNPASARMAGYEVVTLPSNRQGRVDVEELDRRMTDEVAALMLTNPNTLGIFENQIERISQIVHERGGMIYMDGANFNALMGWARPGDMGIDVLHLNLHKTLSTPHGGGGPGCGALACKQHLAPFMPAPVVERQGVRYRFKDDLPASIGRLHAFYGNFGMMIRALCYILSCGKDGLKELSSVAVLSANYLRARLASHYELPFQTPSLHEVVFSDRRQAAGNVRTIDIAKRLIDFGFHPPTIYFPLIVPGAMMIEPTESQSKEELDAFVEAMIQIAREAEEDPELVRNAPHQAKLGRLDEARAARRPVLRWRPNGDGT